MAFIMGYGYISDLSAADKEKHVEKIRDFTKKEYMRTRSIRRKTEVYPSVCPVFVRSFVEFVPFIRYYVKVNSQVNWG